jgi:TRAP-type uncharacterized transport system substrate-binding protein
LLTLAGATVALIVFFGAAAVSLLALRPETLRVAVGPRDGIDVTILQALSRELAQQNSKIRLRLSYVENPNVSFSLVSSGQAELAVIRADSLPDEAMAVAVLRKSAVLLWSTGKDKIDTLKDVKGGQVGVLGGDPSDLALVTSILDQSGHQLQVSSLSTAELSKAAHGFTLIALIADPRSKIARNALAMSGRSSLVAIDTAEAIVRSNPRLESDELPRASLSAVPPLPSEPLQTIRVAHFLLASKEMSEESGAALARALHTSRYAVLREIGSEASLEMADTEKDAAVPAHPGVASYIDGTERTFFERYSDVFWGTVLLLSGLGSAGAWFRAFYYREELDDTATMRDRLLTLASDARAATANDKIVTMELSADAILRDVLDRYEDGAIDDGTLAAFGLALEHFRDVARARKAELPVSPAP